MACNVGRMDRAARMVIGLILLALAFFSGWPMWAEAIVYILGVIAVLTGLFRFCPLWWLIGVNTCGADGTRNPQGDSISTGSKTD